MNGDEGVKYLYRVVIMVVTVLVLLVYGMWMLTPFVITMYLLASIALVYNVVMLVMVFVKRREVDKRQDATLAWWTTRDRLL